MTQTQLFLTMFTTALFAIGAVRELARRNFAMGAILLAVPTCGWLSIWVSS